MRLNRQFWTNRPAFFPGAGLTLVELIVVIAIIGVLTTLSVASFSYARSHAREKKARHDLAIIYESIAMLANDTNEWPGNQTVLAVGSGSDNEICADGCVFGLGGPAAGLLATDGSFVNWSGPYLNSVLTDPWGNEYFFDTDYRITVDEEPCPSLPCWGDAAVLGSYGEDGVGNNQYNSDDIIRVLAK